MPCRPSFRWPALLGRVHRAQRPLTVATRARASPIVHRRPLWTNEGARTSSPSGVRWAARGRGRGQGAPRRTTQLNRPGYPTAPVMRPPPAGSAQTDNGGSRLSRLDAICVLCSGPNRHVALALSVCLLSTTLASKDTPGADTPGASGGAQVRRAATQREAPRGDRHPD